MTKTIGTHRIIGSLLFFIISHQVLAGGIRGIVRDKQDQPLPYVAILVKNTTKGTISNPDGKYELSLEAGHYEIVFQQLGYATQVQKVTVGGDFQMLNVTLAEQSLAMNEVKIRANAEDPAYSIMRKAIATAEWHRREVESFKANIYVKGGGQMSVPQWIEKAEARERKRDSIRVAQGKKLKKEADTLDLDMKDFFVENTSTLQFRQPNTYISNVAAIQSNIADQASPFPYILNNYYEPRIGDLVTPLAPSAFGVYKFSYEGSFQDRGYEVNKIRVTPRSPGDDVMDGTIYIVENTWSIHSLDVRFSVRGTDFSVVQQLAPIQNVWMPVTHQVFVTLKIFGFGFDIKYYASVSDYDLVLNEMFHNKIGTTLIDPKNEETPSTAQNRRKSELLQLMEEDKPLTIKQMRQLGRVLRKEQAVAEKEAETRRATRIDSVIIDSLAYKRSALYWAQNRSIPLSENESKTLDKFQKTYQVRQEKAIKDSIKLQKQVLNMLPLTGGSFHVGPRTELDFGSLLLSASYNGAEGRVYSPLMRIRHQLPRQRQFWLSAFPRFSQTTTRFTGMMSAYYKTPRQSITVAGGRFISQFNPANPIPYLFGSPRMFQRETRNLLKIYEKSFVSITYAHKFSEGLVASLNVENAQRFWQPVLDELVTRDSILRTSNRPISDELAETDFSNHQAFLVNATLRYRPFVRYEIHNGKKMPILNATPELSLRYRRALPNLFGSTADFTHVELGIAQNLRLGIYGRFDYSAALGTFTNTNRLYFMDYHHFQSNAFRFLTNRGVGALRTLDLYRHSTAGSYAQAGGIYEFRKFLLTRIPKIRKWGIREQVLGNFLYVSNQRFQFMEAGYALDGLLRLMRLEVVSSFQNGRYWHTALRFGIAMNLGGKFAKQFQDLDEQVSNRYF